jgi:ABC-type Zn uptake system ZnuABC Zn-binding protein ZnuA
MVLALAACGGSGDDVEEATAGPSPAVDRSETPWKIVVSMPILADMAHIVGGDQVTVTTLIPPGADPHTYVPPDELGAAVQEADIVFVNGLGLDQPAIDFIQANRPPGRQFLIDIVRNIPSPTTPQPVTQPIYAKDVGDDPHLWLDLNTIHIYAETISHSLIIIDGLNEAFYDATYFAYKAQLDDLRQSVAEQMAAIPPQNRGLRVTAHDSLEHFARRYGLQVIATLAEDGEQGVAQAIEQRRPPAVFAEAGIASEVLTQLAAGAGIEVCTLYTDTIEEGMSFIEMVEHDAEEIARCLGG